MLRSLFSGISGLRAHQTMMDVVANNIANVNTTGYKTSNAVFEDTLSQLVRAAGAPGAGLGSTNPSQVGLGVQVGAIEQNFTQGSAQVTNKPTDLMIDGDGFFVIKRGNEQIYTRAGAFTFDTDGFLTNSDGNFVQGFPAVDGVVDPYAPLTNIRLQVGSVIPSSPTSQVTIGGNIPQDNTNTISMSQNVYDIRGIGHPLTITLTYNGTDGYTVAVTDGFDGSTGSGSITFDQTTGEPNSGSGASIELADGTEIDISLSGLTNYAGVQSYGIKDHDGFPAGSLNQFQISPNGNIIGIYSNGTKRLEGQVAIANFNNVNGLEKIGDTTYRVTPNSGIAQVGPPQTGGRGVLSSGTLEMSNVDLGAEFTNLIIAQRGFQANSRIITSSDEMLQELVNIKR